MTSLKNVGVRATYRWLYALDKHLKNINFDGSRNDYILAAVQSRVESESGQLPAPKAPHGVRNDALPDGWRSRLYKNRYQIVAVIAPEDVYFHHWHELPDEPQLPFLATITADEVLPGDGNKVEVYVYGATKMDADTIKQGLRLPLSEWLGMQQDIP